MANFTRITSRAGEAHRPRHGNPSSVSAPSAPSPQRVGMRLEVVS